MLWAFEDIYFSRKYLHNKVVEPKAKNQFHLKVAHMNCFQLNGLYFTMQGNYFVIYCTSIEFKYIRNTNASVLVEQIPNLLEISDLFAKIFLSVQMENMIFITQQNSNYKKMEQ